MKKIIVIILTFLKISAFSQEKLIDSLDFYVGVGMGATASGLPSQISNEVAKKEGFIEGTYNETGLPISTSIFTGVGYKVTKNFSLGLEYGFGYNIDGGKADIKIGKVVPSYIIEAIRNSDFDEGYKDLAENMAGSIYPGMTVKNTRMKGSFWDQKLLAYTKVSSEWKEIPVGFQLGLGLKTMHMQDYYAIQSKNPRDYLPKFNSKEGLDHPVFWNLLSVWAAKPVYIPFPLQLSNGEVLMYPHQLLFNVSLRANMSLFYVDVDYATEFKYIHNTKVTVGFIFDREVFSI